jgi:hypothetical protein
MKPIKTTVTLPCDACGRAAALPDDVLCIACKPKAREGVTRPRSEDARQRLIRAIEHRIGLRLEPGRHANQLYAVAPKGERLFTVSIYGEDGNWKFGGVGALLAEQWESLCDLGRE